MQYPFDQTKKYPWATHGLIITNVIIFFSIELSDQSTLNVLDLLDWGANFNPYTFDEEWWRLFSSMFLHIGVFHLVANMYSLYRLGSYLETQFGHRAFIIVYFVTGLSGSFVSGFFNLYVVSAGASGAIFGIYGFHIFQVLIREWHDKEKLLKSVAGFILYVAAITWIGTKANFDNAAHMGGLVAGIIISILGTAFHGTQSQSVYVKVLIVCSIMAIIVYYCMPRYQVVYFKMYQLFLENEDSTVSNMNAINKSDSIMVQEMMKVRMKWDTLKQQVDTLPGLPEVLNHDRDLISYYSDLRMQEAGYIIESIRQESYVYFDSLEVVRASMRTMPKLNFYLNYKRVKKDTTQESNRDEEQLQFAKTYYDSLWKECGQWNAQYYRLGYKDSLDRWTGFVQDYYKDGAIQMKGKYSADLRDGIFLYYAEDSTYTSAGVYEADTPVGKWESYKGKVKIAEVRYDDGRAYTMNTWDSIGNPIVVQGNGEEVNRYDNGVISSYVKYVDGRLEGECYGYHRNGKPYYREYYANGQLLHGIAYSISGDKHEYDVATYIPHPIGGASQFEKYIEENKVYPTKAKEDNIVGELEIIFMVYADGTVGDVKFLNYLGYGCEEEAERLLLEGGKWIPAHLHGVMPISAQSSIKINFP